MVEESAETEVQVVSRSGSSRQRRSGEVGRV